jgi:hypothetical protein
VTDGRLAWTGDNGELPATDEHGKLKGNRLLEAVETLNALGGT